MRIPRVREVFWAFVLILFVLLWAGVVEVGAQTLPELPRVTVDTSQPCPASKVTVPVGGNLQAAINSVGPGTTVELQAGATYGAVTLPAKSGTGWICIQSNGQLPAPGNRVYPMDAPKLAKIQVAASAAISTSQGAHHYRFVGIEVSVTGTLQAAVVDLSAGGPSTQPHHIILDRCYIHAGPSNTARRGVSMHGADLAVIDSYVSDFKESGSDSQAIVSWNGTGPLLIQNNYLSASGENLMTGGSDPTSGTVGPSDITIRGNHFYKPTTWKGSNWTVKNLLEFKNGRRVLVEGNVLENNWAANQNGFSILVTPRNQDGGCSGCGTQDITIRWNKLVNGQQGINVMGDDNDFPSTRTQRVLIANNEFNLCCVSGSDGKGFQTTRGPVNVTFDHNTWTRVGTQSFHENTPKAAGFVFTNNIIPDGSYGLLGTGTGNPGATLAGHFASPVWTGNALVGASASAYTNYPGNTFPSSVATASPNAGVSVTALATALACTVSGQCAGVVPPDPLPPVPVDGVCGPWSAWSDWAPINSTTEARTRSRVETSPPANGGKPCAPLNEVETRPVVPPSVPVDCQAALVPVVSGNTVTVTWTIVTPPQNGGKPCSRPADVTVVIR